MRGGGRSRSPPPRPLDLDIEDEDGETVEPKREGHEGDGSTRPAATASAT